MLPGTTGNTTGTATDEAVLATNIGTLAAANGWTVTSANVTPATSRWFQSSGEDGMRNIVGGLLPNTSTRRITGFIAADFDNQSIISAQVGGYVNDDTVGIASRVQAQTTAIWAVRDVGTSYSYVGVANRDAISFLVFYTSGGTLAQGWIYIGTVDPLGREKQKLAKARILTVGAGGIGAQRLFTLDRNITSLLKDTGAGGGTYPNDPSQQFLFFQPILAAAADAPDFAMVERKQIIPGTLLTNGSNQTTFECNVQNGFKLFAGGTRRYQNNRGVNDIVRLHAEPNICVCNATINGAAVSTAANNTALASWEAYGGQQQQLNLSLGNQDCNANNQNNAPETVTNRVPYYAIYATTQNTVPNLIPQADRQGIKNVGVLFNTICAQSLSTPNLAFSRINGDSARRYRHLQRIAAQGMLPPDGFASFASTSVTMAVGPGW